MKPDQPDARAHVLLVGGSGDPLVPCAPPSSVLTVSLPHPRTNEHVLFLLIDGQPHELQRLADGDSGSWLVGQTVQEDGAMLLASPIDPVFFVLARLFAARRARVATAAARGGAQSEPPRTLYEPLSDVLTVLEAPALGLLADAPRIAERLAAAADVNSKYGEPLVRLDEGRALRWLRAKVEQLRQRRPPLAAGRGGGGEGAVCAGTLIEDDGAPAPFRTAQAAPALEGLEGARADDAASAAARAAEREAERARRPALSELGALALLGEYCDDELLGLVAAHYGLTVAAVRAEALEAKPPSMLASAATATAARAAARASTAAADDDIAAAEAEAARAGPSGAQRQPAAAAARPPAAAPAAKKAKTAPALAALAKTDVRRMQPLTSFFAKKS